MKVITALCMVVLLTSVAFGQQYAWQHIGVFPPAGQAPGDTIFKRSAVHGIAVDAEGKVWVQGYYVWPGDSITVESYSTDRVLPLDSVAARKIGLRVLHVYWPNGQEVSWSPVKFADIPGGGRDTIGEESIINYLNSGQNVHTSGSFNSGAGLRKSPLTGNIYASYWDYVYAFDYKTGQCTGKIATELGGTLTAVAVDSFDYVYARRVVAGTTPIQVWDNNFVFAGNADTCKAFSRTIDCSRDGTEIYDVGFTSHYVRRITSASATPPYVCGANDTLFKGFDCESMAWDSRGRLWASSGSYNDRPNRFPGLTTNYDIAAWYVVDPVTNTVGTEKINWEFFVPNNANERPRAIDFSPTGDTAYAGVFGGTAEPGIRAFRRYLVSVEPVESGIPEVYTLTQNYPNPFNPTTDIQFSIPKQGMTTLRVYDVLGKEITTLVNEMLAPGTYKSRWDASKMASGTYIFTIVSGNFHQSKKMLLLK